MQGRCGSLAEEDYVDVLLISKLQATMTTPIFILMWKLSISPGSSSKTVNELRDALQRWMPSMDKSRMMAGILFDDCLDWSCYYSEWFITMESLQLCSVKCWSQRYILNWCKLQSYNTTQKHLIPLNIWKYHTLTLWLIIISSISYSITEWRFHIVSTWKMNDRRCFNINNSHKLSYAMTLHLQKKEAQRIGQKRACFWTCSKGKCTVSKTGNQ